MGSGSLTPKDWHALRGEEAVAALSTSASAGLDGEEVARRRERFGPNALPEAPRHGLVAVFVHQLASPLIYLLLGAAALALVLGEISDAAVISAVVLLNAVIGAYQEGRAEAALVALRRLSSAKAHVVRDGTEAVVDASDLVPGDILILAAGDAVAADARLVDGAALQIAEAALTGESLPVVKDLVPVAPETPLADRSSMVFAGTHVTAGRARAVVVGTGPATEIGRIASLAESERPPQTPLERRVDELGRFVMVMAAAVFAAIVAVGWLRGLPLGQVAMLGISQVVGMVPEGLPVAMTIALSVGVQRMARRRAIVRKLSAVETLGCTTVICSDKTGTLTGNEMTVTAVVLPGRGEIAVSGEGYDPKGEFTEAGHPITVETDALLGALLEAGALCNDAQILGPDASSPAFRAVGDPTEAALVTLAIKGGLVPVALHQRWPRRAELPFDSGAKLMATQHVAAGASRVVIKGAPEAVLRLCGLVQHAAGALELSDAGRAELRRAAEGMADRALRVLAVAVMPDAEIDPHAGFEVFHGRAKWLGLVGQMDPPRAEAEGAVKQCRAAGIRPVMVTGDHLATGVAVARSLGIARDGDLAVDGAELSRLSEDALAERLDRVSVFARVHPAQKLRIVQAYQARGHVVAMTGDGVNDAPALVRADVGVAMGLTGTDVAKEAAKIVVTDDDFATIVSAVEEGRVVYRNIKKAVLFLLATSLAEVLVLLLALLLGFPPPFVAVQILWNNLVTEGVIIINLVMDPAEGDEMQRPPIASAEPLLSRALLSRLVFMTPVIVVVTLGWFGIRCKSGVPLEIARTEAFTLLAVCEWFNVLNCRSEQKSAFRLDLLGNPWLLAGLLTGNLLQLAVVFWAPLGRLFHTVPLGLHEVVAIGVVGSAVLWVEELRKIVARRAR